MDARREVRGSADPFVAVMVVWRSVSGISRASLLVLTIAALCSCSGDTPNLAFHRALNAVDEGRWDWARVYLEDDLQAHPDRLETRRLLGLAWISEPGSRLDQGQRILTEVVALDPSDRLSHRRLILTLVRLGRQTQALEHAERLDEGHDTLLLQAQLTIDTDPTTALGILDRVHKASPDTPGLQVLRSRGLENLGRFDDARIASRNAMLDDPLNQEVLARLMRLSRYSGHLDEAKAIGEILATSSRLHHSRGADRLAPHRELELIERLLLDTGLTEARGPLAVRQIDAQLRAGRIPEAMEGLDRLERNDPPSIADRLSIARRLFDAAHLKSAEEMYRSALDEDPTHIAARSSIALVQRRLGHADTALAGLEDAIEQIPWSARLRATRALILLHSNRAPEAEASLETALSLAPWMDEWRDLLAEIHRTRGDFDRATAVLAAAPAGPRSMDRGPDTGAIHGASSVAVALDFPSPAPAPNQPPTAAPWFLNVAASIGLDFVQYDGRTGRRYYVETTGSGGGFLDFDDDGDLDIYLLTGAPTPGAATDRSHRNALFENRDGRFVNIGRRAGVDDDGFGMGLCVGDVDGDDRLDFLVANYGEDRLYRNLGDGRFEEIAASAGVDDPRWSTNCAFGDLDGDGDHDLVVTHYLDFNFEDNPFCGDPARGISGYCRPTAFRGVPDSLFINQGDGTFRDESSARGFSQDALEKGFGVILTDIDVDGDLDVFVANDATPNRLYLNNGAGFFEDHALRTGIALSSMGSATSGMGVDIADVDGDARSDVVVTNYSMESNSVYLSMPGPMLRFDDASNRTGVAASSMIQVGWGVRLFDADNDGDRDMAVANGHVVDNIAVFEPSHTYAQPNQLLLNDGDGVFQDIGDAAGLDLVRARVSRSLATGDWNNDGRLDLLIGNSNDRFDLLENQVDNANHWLGVRLVGPPGERISLGARVTARTTSGRVLRDEVRSGGSFQSQSDLRLHFGLGNDQGPVTLEILWPDGTQQTAIVASLNRYIDIHHRGTP